MAKPDNAEDRRMNEYTKVIKAKGWTAKDVAARWHVSSSTMTRICKSPKPKDLDALSGLPDNAGMSSEELAERFHKHYEAMAPVFGYETRPETKAFNPNTPNGKLMIAVCEQIINENGAYNVN